MRQLFETRNRDASVTLEWELANPGDNDFQQPGRWWIETNDGKCNNARWNDEDQEPKPSRHVEVGFIILGFVFKMTVCVTLLPSRELVEYVEVPGYKIPKLHRQTGVFDL